MKREIEEFDLLRDRAEKLLNTRGDSETIKAFGEMDEVLHELEIHQTELEITNEELRKAQQELQFSRDRYLEWYDFAPVGYLTLNKDAFIIDANLTAARMLGVGRDKLIRSGFDRFAAAEDRDRVFAMCRRVSDSQEPQTVEIKLAVKEGEDIFVHMNCLPQRIADHKGINCSMTDITERKRAEEKAMELMQSSLEQSRQLVDAYKELEIFSYSISHDLRAPLRAIDGFAHVLDMDYGEKLDGEGKRVLGVIRESAQNMGRLIDSLLAFTLTGRTEIQESEINMTELAQKVIDQLRDDLEKCAFTVKVGDLPKAKADPGLMRVVLQNLLSNACKFTSSVKNPSIQVSGRIEGDELVYCIKDNGVGFDMKYADKLFKVFHRLHTVDEFKGMGIGLALAHRIVHRHGGRIWAEAAPGMGATFSFTLPR